MVRVPIPWPGEIVPAPLREPVRVPLPERMASSEIITSEEKVTYSARIISHSVMEEVPAYLGDELMSRVEVPDFVKLVVF